MPWGYFPFPPQPLYFLVILVRVFFSPDWPSSTLFFCSRPFIASFPSIFFSSFPHCRVAVEAEDCFSPSFVFDPFLGGSYVPLVLCLSSFFPIFHVMVDLFLFLFLKRSRALRFSRGVCDLIASGLCIFRRSSSQG